MRSATEIVVAVCIRHPWWTLAAYLVACALAVVGIARLEHEDDALVFLPADDADVQLFRGVDERFGSMRVALVGVAVDAPRDVLEPARLQRIAAATTALAEEHSVARVDSITNVTDVRVSDDGVIVDLLVPTALRSDAEHDALRSRVLANELVVGTLVSSDLSAATLMVFLAPGADTGDAVERIRAVSERELAGFELHFAGAPFFADAIYGDAARDVKHLSPLAVVVLIAVVLLSFRDAVGLTLVFATVVIAVLVVLGTMGFVGERTTVLTSTMPVLSMATGSAYAVHVLGRYYLEREQLGPKPAIQQALRIVARPVAIAAGTTCAAFLAFTAMDVAPVRAFGLEIALGTAVCWWTSITLIPAVLALVPRQPQREQLLPLGRALAGAWRFTDRHRKAVLGVLALVTLASAWPMRHVSVRTEAQAFLAEDTPAWRAQKFFDERFGGARFVQVLVEGDLQDPGAMRALAMVVERASALPGVTQVSAATDPVALTIELLGGRRRLPATRSQAGKVFLFLDGTPALGPLLGADHMAALVQIRVSDDAIAIVSTLEEWLGSGALETDPLDRTIVVQRLGWLATGFGGRDDPATLGAAFDRAVNPGAEDLDTRTAAARGFLASEDCVDLTAEVRGRIERELAAGVAPARAIRSAIADPADADFYAELFERAVSDARHRSAVDRTIELFIAAMAVDDTPALRHRLQPLVEDLVDPQIESEHAPVVARVTGEPVLDRALARSVERNQLQTMALGLAVVLALLIVLFRSITLALCAVAPAVITAMLVGGVMGMLGVQMDLSTAMVGAILTDTASDFGMHYLWYLRREPHEHVVRTVGPIAVVSSLLVALGFFAFSMGTSPVMHVFGALSGATCIVSALVTCALVPALWRWVGPGATRADLRRPGRHEGAETARGVRRDTR
jgi:hypothetical protein